MEQNPVGVPDTLQHWQRNAELAAVRGDKALAALPADESPAWQKLWDDVALLRKKARSPYSETQLSGALSVKERQQVHEHKMTAGKTYVIDLEGPQFDTYLRLEDAQGKVLAENKGGAPENLNSRRPGHGGPRPKSTTPA